MPSRRRTESPRERLVYHVHELERLEELKAQAAKDLREALDRAQGEGYDKTTLKVVLKLRKMTPTQRQERRALEAIYLAALGMLEGDPLPEEARRRLDRPDEPPAGPRPDRPSRDDDETADTSAPRPSAPPPAAAPAQPPLILKEPAEAREEGAAAAAAGKRIYDNPYAAGDPCRAAWDEGWCSQRKSHGMDTPAAFQRRTPPKKKDPDGDREPDQGDGDAKRGAA